MWAPRGTGQSLLEGWVGADSDGMAMGGTVGSQKLPYSGRSGHAALTNIPPKQVSQATVSYQLSWAVRLRVVTLGPGQLLSCSYTF